MAEGAGPIVGLTMLQQHRLDVGVPRQQAYQLPAAIAVESDNSHGSPEHFLQYATSGFTDVVR